MFEESSLWIFSLAWFLGAFVQSVGGMGAVMVALPICANYMQAQTLVPATCICVAIFSASMSFTYRKDALIPSLKSLTIGAIPGAIAGLFILLFTPSSLLQVVTGLILIFFILCKRKPSSHKNKETFASGSIAGFLSGFINTSIGLGNPPVAMYSLYAGWSHFETLATMNLFRFLVSILTMACHYGAGLYTADVLHHVLWGAPATVLGMVAGLPIARHIDQNSFRRILRFLILVSGCICFMKGLRHFF